MSIEPSCDYCNSVTKYRCDNKSKYKCKYYIGDTMKKIKSTAVINSEGDSSGVNSVKHVSINPYSGIATFTMNNGDIVYAKDYRAISIEYEKDD